MGVGVGVGNVVGRSVSGTGLGEGAFLNIVGRQALFVVRIYILLGIPRALA